MRRVSGICGSAVLWNIGWLSRKESRSARRGDGAKADGASLGIALLEGEDVNGSIGVPPIFVSHLACASTVFLVGPRRKK